MSVTSMRLALYLGRQLRSPSPGIRRTSPTPSFPHLSSGNGTQALQFVRQALYRLSHHFSTCPLISCLLESHVQRSLKYFFRCHVPGFCTVEDAAGCRMAPSVTHIKIEENIQPQGSQMNPNTDIVPCSPAHLPLPHACSLRLPLPPTLQAACWAATCHHKYQHLTRWIPHHCAVWRVLQRKLD